MTGEALHAAADIYIEDYVKNRIPPPQLGDDAEQTIHVPQMYAHLAIWGLDSFKRFSMAVCLRRHMFMVYTSCGCIIISKMKGSWRDVLARSPLHCTVINAMQMKRL